jgi:outer membrane protein with beta-barrel domain
MMIRVHFSRLMLVLLLIAGSTRVVSAQALEAYIFGGANGRGSKVFDAKIPSGGTYGFKFGGFFDQNVELDGNLSWYNHFGLSAPEGVEIFHPVTDVLDTEVRALLWEASASYNFGARKVGAQWTPYVTFGAGGITSRLKNADSIFVTGGGFVRNPLFSPGSSRPALIPNPARQIVMDDNDTFFTISYGGGIKAMKLWGPAGVRFEIRGRTIPNFYSEGVTRAEYTGGLLLSWGER